jgi:hypothetical protein
MADIKQHIKTFKNSINNVSGPKGFSLSAPVIRDDSDQPDNYSFKEFGHFNFNKQTPTDQVNFHVNDRPLVFPTKEIQAEEI